MYSHNKRRIALGRRGFSLLELLIVVAILGILSVAVGVYINSAPTKTKAFVFNLSARFKQAKFMAVTRDHVVYLDFDFNADGNIDNGYTIWQENINPATYDPWGPLVDDGDGVCEEDEADCVLETVVFDNKLNPAFGKEGPEIYDGTATGGPAAVGGGPAGHDIAGGVSAPNYRFMFRPGGDSPDNGYAYIYFPSGIIGSESVAAGPWAIKVNSVGRISVDEWQASTGQWKVNQ